MEDFEKLGVFYLGKTFDLESNQTEDDLVLYKSKDLTTHAAIIGMTGSGKTGLGIGILEEAAMDRIPVLVIDPKGDMGNLALTFPEFEPAQFLPWVNVHEAAQKGTSPEDYAQSQAQLWQEGLSQWGQDGDRLRKLKAQSQVCVYTPGSSAGESVSVLSSFQAPPPQLREDLEAYREKIEASATGLLALAGLAADPMVSREHILLSTLLEKAWNEGKNLTLSELVLLVQTPGLQQVGVMDLESFFPSKERFALAMRFNSLLASPSFKSWQEGQPLDIQSFLYNQEGKPKISVFTIAHLSEAERMFFVSMLLNEILAWVRTQSGTSSLRALLYMDELYGYLPPTANPPSKKPLMTLLKQARAYGLGLILSTQNPVDLDYKALSNIGTWFIGRLQTERDKARVMDGLESASAGVAFDRRQIERILSGLGKRVFYLHSVHENRPLLFQTRWTMSYLAGPLTREQIAALPLAKGNLQKLADTTDSKASLSPGSASLQEGGAAPVLPAGLKQVFLPADSSLDVTASYLPGLVGVADIHYNSTKHQVDHTRRLVYYAPFSEGPLSVIWHGAQEIPFDLEDLSQTPEEGWAYGALPPVALQVQNYPKWEKYLSQYLRTSVPLTLLYSPSLRLTAQGDEDERSFRIRLQHAAHEKRDDAIDQLQKKYASKIRVLEDRQRRARQALEKQSVNAQQKKLDAAVSTGTALLGALFGGKKLSTTVLSKVGTAMKSANRARQSGESIEQTQETLQAVEGQLLDLQQQLQAEADLIASQYDVMEERLEEITIRATQNNILIHLVALGWKPQVS